VNLASSQALVPAVLATTKQGFKVVGSNTKYLDSIAAVSADLIVYKIICFSVKIGENSIDVPSVVKDIAVFPYTDSILPDTEVVMVYLAQRLVEVKVAVVELIVQ